MAAAPALRIAAAVMAACAALLGAAPARADSACWPEARTLGRQAQALWSLPPDATLQLPRFDAQGQPLGRIACTALFNVNGGCEAEWSFVPLQWSAVVPGLAQVPLSDGALAWLRPRGVGTVAPILAVGREGRLVPPEAVLRAAPSLASAAVQVAPAAVQAARAFTARQKATQASPDAAPVVSPRVRTLARVHNAEGEWFRVRERLTASADDGITFRPGPAQRSGYLLHRDAQGVVRAVIENVYCD